MEKGHLRRKEVMTGRILATPNSHHLLLAFVLLLCVAAISACAKQAAQSQARPKDEASQAKPRSPAKIMLNTLEMGFTNDTSLLNKTLAKIMKDRESFGGQKAVLIRAEDSLKVSEVVKVMQSIAEAGANPMKFNFEITEEKAASLPPPDLWTLAVTIGEPDSGGLKFAISPGIELLLAVFSLKRAEINTLPKEFLGVELVKDGSYVIDGKPITRSALLEALQARLKDTSAKRIVAMIEKDAEISYGSLKALADAAFEAHFESLQLLTLQP
jgi:biopolymer transport protein ExbD